MNGQSVCCGTSSSSVVGASIYIRWRQVRLGLLLPSTVWLPHLLYILRGSSLLVFTFRRHCKSSRKTGLKTCLLHTQIDEWQQKMMRGESIARKASKQFQQCRDWQSRSLDYRGAMLPPVLLGDAFLLAPWNSQQLKQITEIMPSIGKGDSIINHETHLFYISIIMIFISIIHLMISSNFIADSIEKV